MKCYDFIIDPDDSVEDESEAAYNLYFLISFDSDKVTVKKNKNVINIKNVVVEKAILCDSESLADFNSSIDVEELTYEGAIQKGIRLVFTELSNYY